MGVLTIGAISNQVGAQNFSAGDPLIGLVGIPLAPAWFLTSRLREKMSFSLSQIFGFVVLSMLVSIVIDTGLIFVTWQLLRLRRESVG